MRLIVLKNLLKLLFDFFFVFMSVGCHLAYIRYLVCVVGNEVQQWLIFLDFLIYYIFNLFLDVFVIKFSTFWLLYNF